MEQSDAAGCERIDPAFRSHDSLSGHWALFREISARDTMKSMKGQLVFIKMFRDVLQTSATSEDVSRKLQNPQWDPAKATANGQLFAQRCFAICCSRRHRCRCNLKAPGAIARSSL